MKLPQRHRAHRRLARNAREPRFPHYLWSEALSDGYVRYSQRRRLYVRREPDRQPAPEIRRRTASRIAAPMKAMTICPSTEADAMPNGVRMYVAMNAPRIRKPRRAPRIPTMMSPARP